MVWINQHYYKSTRSVFLYPSIRKIMDRRKFLIGSGATLAAAAGFSKSGNVFAAGGNANAGNTLGNADGDPQPIITQFNDLTPYSGPWTDQTLRHLLRRAMFGVPLAQFQTAQTLGSMSAVVAQLLTDKPTPAAPGTYVGVIAPPDPGDLSQSKLLAAQDANALEQMRIAQVADWWMSLILNENLSITEHMTLLWSNHFVTGTDVVQKSPYVYTYNQTLRANALGNMKTFVKAISIDPAMLLYLNGNQNYDGTPPPGTSGSKGTNINENFARELQELFTLGLFDPVSGQANYSENDVQQAAVALTGWAPTTTAPFVGTFYPNSHSTQQITFLGQPGNTMDDIINIIFNYTGPGKNTRRGFNSAYWFCQKIYMEFVYYIPNPQVITAMANLMLDNNWEVKPVLSALLQSDHFYSSDVQNAQLKGPVNFIASLVREFGLTFTPFSSTDPPWDGTSRNGNNIKIYTDPNISLSYMTLSTAYGAAELGQQLLQPPNVKGWPGGHNWISTGTFPEREVMSSILLSNPPILNGGTNVKGVSIEFVSPTAWANAIPNSGTMTIHDIGIQLTTLVLNKALGTNESNTLYLALNPSSLPDSDNYLTDPNVKAFAIVLAQLPEFQLV
jgi:uncharacterized protein (DUF1800 family)